ncbi:MAG: hypothetical protein ACI9N9_002894 [Enterobacterales bacterium]|jgi:hypothetical protein
MTTINILNLECFFCGTISEHQDVGSTNCFGSCDLDTRPAEMERSTICYWIQRCPQCGYCAKDISEGVSHNKSIIQSAEYQKIVHKKSISKLASSFLAHSFEMKKVKDHSAAAWSAIHSAWVCDDRNSNASAKSSRLEAIRMIKMIDKDSNGISDQAGASEGITIDLMRRAEQFDEALALANKALSDDIEEMIKEVIRFEVQLIEKKDVSVHSASEAFDEI